MVSIRSRLAAAAEIKVLRCVAGQIDGAARTDILKAVVILTDRGHGDHHI